MNKKEIKVDLSKFGTPCEDCKGYHDAIATSGDNTASSSERSKCGR